MTALIVLVLSVAILVIRDLLFVPPAPIEDDPIAVERARRSDAWADRP